jgi:hypothetical protein
MKKRRLVFFKLLFEDIFYAYLGLIYLVDQKFCLDDIHIFIPDRV